jgi:hypothetical protein
MFIGKLLNQTATLNDFRYLSTLDFVTGSKINFKAQIFNTELDLRYVLPSTAVVTFMFNQSDGEVLEIAGTPMTDDRSIIELEIPATETENLIGGNVQLEIDILGDETDIRKGVIQNALSRFLDI